MRERILPPFREDIQFAVEILLHQPITVCRIEPVFWISNQQIVPFSVAIPMEGLLACGKLPLATGYNAFRAAHHLVKKMSPAAVKAYNAQESHILNQDPFHASNIPEFRASVILLRQSAFLLSLLIFFRVSGFTV